MGPRVELCRARADNYRVEFQSPPASPLIFMVDAIVPRNESNFPVTSQDVCKIDGGEGWDVKEGDRIRCFEILLCFCNLTSLVLFDVVLVIL